MSVNLLYRYLPTTAKTYLDVYSRLLAYHDIISANIILKNKYRGESCYILTNGPSLNDHDLTKLKNCATFALNHFSLHPQYRQINPKFYLALDPVILTRPLLFNHFYPQINRAKLTGTKFFFSITAMEQIRQRKLFPTNPVHYISGLPTSLSSPKQFNLAGISSYTDSTSAFVLLLAHYMGFKKIYILGSDFEDFLEGESHFYPNFRRHEKDPHLLNRVKMADRAMALHNILRQFEYIGDYLKSKGVKIYNASRGYLDVFPRVKYEKLTFK